MEQQGIYQAIPIAGFGWINCDRFYQSNVRRINVDLSLSQDTIYSATFYAIFMDINSLMIYNYQVPSKAASFQRIPSNRKVKFVGITVKDSVPYWFEQDLIKSRYQEIVVDFHVTSEKEIRERFDQMR